MVDLVLGQGGTLKAEHGTGRIMAPYVRRQYGDELYEVMQEIKRLCDPRRILNPGILLNEDPRSFGSNLKVTPTGEREVDRCVECGFCDPVCPSKDLTLTPRQRIVLRRDIATAKASGDKVLLKDLKKKYNYAGIDTCAVDGMCQTACPVDIDTGDLVRRLRAEYHNPAKKIAWKQAAKNWGLTTRIGSMALNTAQGLPAPLITLTTTSLRKVFGADSFPLWEKDLPSGGDYRLSQGSKNPQVVYFPSCVSAIFGTRDNTLGVGTALLALCNRVGIETIFPDGVGDMCCGTPWKSKGLIDGFQEMRNRILPILSEASNAGQLPIVTDASSCTEGLEHLTPIRISCPTSNMFINSSRYQFVSNAHRRSDRARSCTLRRMGLLRIRRRSWHVTSRTYSIDHGP
jgi:D-lactate dehydrogenase